MFDPAALRAARASQSAQRRVAEVRDPLFVLYCILASQTSFQHPTKYSYVADISELCCENANNAGELKLTDIFLYNFLTSGLLPL